VIIGIVKKGTDDVLDYDVDFVRWLSGNDQISTANAISSLDSVAVDSVQIFGDVVKIWLSGGNHGETATIEVSATTTEGRTKVVCFEVRIVGCT
jgi:hypothetical protein